MKKYGMCDDMEKRSYCDEILRKILVPNTPELGWNERIVGPWGMYVATALLEAKDC